MPHSSASAASPLELLGLTSDRTLAVARERVGRGHGFAAAIHRAAHRGGRFAPEEHGAGAASAARWRAAFACTLPAITARRAQDGPHGATAKFAFADGFEAVLIPMGRGRHSLCLSSQLGCKMACAFCETGLMGLRRQLAAHEIVGQVVAVIRATGIRPDRLVFMGMGEALDNCDAVIPALEALADRRGLAYAHHDLTICTSGHAAGLRRLRALGWKRLNLSLSLNAADDELRDRLMPVNRATPLAELHALLREVRGRANTAMAVNYCLLPGINDRREDARGVARFCDGLGRVMVNVIPYNPGSAPIARIPSDEETDRFVAWLRADGCAVRRRVTKGRDIMAACGQLGGSAAPPATAPRYPNFPKSQYPPR